MSKINLVTNLGVNPVPLLLVRSLINPNYLDSKRIRTNCEASGKDPATKMSLFFLLCWQNVMKMLHETDRLISANCCKYSANYPDL